MIRITKDTDKPATYALILMLQKGAVFKFDEQHIRYETVYAKILRAIDPTANEVFAIEYVQPGTALYTTYGHSTCVVVTHTVDGTEYQLP